MKTRKKNLSLSDDTIRQGESLMVALRRPSFTNLVEALIDAEHKRLFSQSQPHPQPQEAAA